MTKQSHDLWLPNQNRPEKYPVPPIDELKNLWGADKTYLDFDEQYYAIAEMPKRQPIAVTAIDLDEVVREAGLAFTKFNGKKSLDKLISKNENCDYGMNNINAPAEIRQDVITSTLQELINSDRVPPVPQFEKIRNIIQEWHKEGAYIVANTSTLPGCEPGTIDFIQKYFPDCFDGLLLPRNHDGNGKVTKAEILEQTVGALEESGFEIYDENLDIIAIEDAAHHAKGYAEHKGLQQCGNVQVFMPGYPWNESCGEPTTLTYDPNTLELKPETKPGIRGIARVAIDNYEQNGTLATFEEADRWLRRGRLNQK